MTIVLMRRGDNYTGIQRKTTTTQAEDGHLQAKDSCLRRKRPSVLDFQPLGLGDIEFL
jgi:hypothetical protein